MIGVFDLNTGTYTDYTLSPRDAVIAAYAQREKRNFNTWTYDQYRDLVQVIDSTKAGLTCVTCGNQAVLCRADQIDTEVLHDYEVEQ